MQTSRSNRPLHVVLTNDAQFIAGGEQYVLHLAEGLRSAGHRVTIAPLAGSDLEAVARERGFETCGIPYGTNGREMPAIAALYRTLRGRGVDIIHSNSTRDRTIAAAAARLLRVRSVASIHSCLSIRRNATHAFRNRFLIDLFTPVGHSTERIMVEQDGIAARRIRVVHIGIPDCDVEGIGALRADARAALGIADNEFLLGNVANLFPFKGHTFLLRALPELLIRFPWLRVAIAGDGELRPALEAEAMTLGVSHAVRFLGRRGDVDRLLPAFDAYVQPSKDFGGETFPVSILEAMACALPVVASDVGDIRYMVDHGTNGFLCLPEDVAQLCAAIARLAGDASLGARMGRASRAIFLERFTRDVMVRNILAAYETVLRHRS